MVKAKAKYIWYDDEGQGRSRFALFRRAFDLTATPEHAMIHLFADSAYQLFVNGRLVEFGPVRFDPRFPIYDTVDLAPHLVVGKNVVAVLVKSFGNKVFRAVTGPGGFIAWGQAETADGEAVDFTTGAGHWTCRRMMSLSRFTAKISFALDSWDLYDQRADEVGWNGVDYDDADWPVAVPLKKQDHWGPLEPRSIPFMSGESVHPRKLLHLMPLANRYDYYSALFEFPELDGPGAAKKKKNVGIRAWIYSPEDQTVSAKVFWGRGWLNGRPLPEAIYADEKILQQVQQWPLKAGWNEFFFLSHVYRDGNDVYMGLPRNRGLKVSARKDEETTSFLQCTDKLSAEQASHLGSLSPEERDREIEETMGGWRDVPASAPADCPCRETSWDDYEEPVEVLSAGGLQDHVFALDQYPEGFSFIVDLGRMRLVIPHLVLDGAQGARVDLTYSERVLPDDRYLLHTFQFQAGDRAVCTLDRLDWLLTQPRGTRYIKVTVRGASGDVSLREFHLRSAHYPAEQIGRFHCSDSALNAIWDMGARTEASDMEDAYVDCIGRERGMYGRDTIIQYHVNLAVFGDHALMGRCMQLYGQSAKDDGTFQCVYPYPGAYFISDFAMELVHGWWDYFRYSGDLDRLRADWPAMLKNLEWFHALSDEREDRLLDADWHIKRGLSSRYGGFHGDNSAPPDVASRAGINCGFTCMYLRSMNAAMRIAERLNDKKNYKMLQGRAEVLREHIATAFWNEERQCYADTLDHDLFSAQANILAVISGAARDDQLEGIRHHVRKQLPGPFLNGYDPSGGTRCGPAYCFYIFEGLYCLGLYDVAENLIHQGWGWMLSMGYVTTPEFFSDGDHSSLCHAWSASPTWYLSRHVLGVKFPEPGTMDTVRFSVETHGVEWAEGTFPHPRGEIRVRWHREGDHIVWDEQHVPEGVTVLRDEG